MTIIARLIGWRITYQPVPSYFYLAKLMPYTPGRVQEFLAGF
jgi:hypothetical protein